MFVVDVARFECLPNRIVRDGVERLREVDRRCPHFDSPLMAFSVQSICMLQGGPLSGKFF